MEVIGSFVEAIGRAEPISGPNFAQNPMKAGHNVRRLEIATTTSREERGQKFPELSEFSRFPDEIKAWFQVPGGTFPGFALGLSLS